MIRPAPQFLRILNAPWLTLRLKAPPAPTMEDLLHFLSALLVIFAPLLLVAWLLQRKGRKTPGRLLD